MANLLASFMKTELEIANVLASIAMYFEAKSFNVLITDTFVAD